MRRSPLLLLLLLALAATMSGILPFRQIIAQGRAVALSEEKLAALESETTRLEEAALLLEAPDEVERLAREEFGYVRPGEVAYVVVTKPGSVAPTVPEATVEVPQRHWWDPITDFLTGQDLDP